MTLATRDLEYMDDGTTLDGVVVLDEGRSDRRPGVLLIHGGAGLDDHARGQAHRYAELGYVVLACDMYGRGVAGDRERVMAMLMGLRDAPDRLAQRAAAGLAALSACPEVNGRFAAVGFCFGGMAALMLARAGARLDAVVSMHGSLTTTKHAEPKAVMAKVLVCHGALDPHVPMADVVAFTEEMTKAGADWQVNVYGGRGARLHPCARRPGGHAGRRVPRRDGPPLVRSRTSIAGRGARRALSRPRIVLIGIAVARHDAVGSVDVRRGRRPNRSPHQWSLRGPRGFQANSPGKGDRSRPRCPGS